MTEDKRIINLRFAFCCFVGIMLGILSSSFLMFQKIKTFVFVLIIFLIVGVVVVGVIYSYILKRSCINTRFRTKLPFFLKWCSIGFGIFVVIGCLITIAPITKLNNLTEYEDDVVVSGIVCDYVDREDSYIQFIVKDCKVVLEDDVEEIDAKIIVNTSVYSDIELGDYVTFVAQLNKFEFGDSYELSMLAKGVGYSTYASTSKMAKATGEIELKDAVHAQVKTVLDNNLNNDNSEICFAILFGQKYGLTDNISNMFSYAGISHILAVSGLHVGVLVGIIWFVLKKLKINDYFKLIIFASILFFYSYLCSFSPSVCRACIMAFTLAFCKVKCFEYDITNSLSLAGCIILLFKPLSLFTVSFQLSFMCIFAIITFAPFLKLCLTKIKCPKVFAETLAISISVNVVILPVCMNIFHKVSLLGIVTNIFVLPIFSITYILLFIITIISMFWGGFGMLLAIPNIFLHLIKTIAHYFSLIPFGVFRVFNVSYWLIVIVALITLTIHFLMVKHWGKYLFVSVLSVLCISIIIAGSLPNKYENDTLILSSQYNSNVLMYIGEDSKVLIGSNVEINSLNKITRKLRIKEIDKIVAYDLQLNKLDDLYEICDEYNVKSIVLPDVFDYYAIVNIFPKVEIIADNCMVKNLAINIIKDQDIIGLELIKCDTSILVPVLENSKAENTKLLDYYSNVDYIVTDDNSFWKDVESNVIVLSNVDNNIFM